MYIGVYTEFGAADGVPLVSRKQMSHFSGFCTKRQYAEVMSEYGSSAVHLATANCPKWCTDG